MTTLHGLAHAKLNLALAVTGRRDDGYHELRSVFVCIALHDDLDVRPAPDGPDDRLMLSALPVEDDGNLVLKAARRLRADLGEDLPPLAFGLRKHIPIGAGLGGGSSDGATAMGLALQAWGRDLAADRRRSIAASLGADVPFFESGLDAALVTGIGEHLEPLPAPDPPIAVVLVTPSLALSTAAVFAAYDESATPKTGARKAVDRLVTAASAGRAELLATLADPSPANDLWPAARSRSPWLGRLADDLADATETPFRLTGSGSTLFATLDTPGDAETLADHVRMVLSGLDENATVRITTTSHQTDGGAA